MNLKNFLKNTIPPKLWSHLRYIKNYYLNDYSYYLNDYSVRSYSQEGEDILLHRIFGNKTNGFYVDIGAHHPIRFSNTYLFYKKGWRGINCDAMPNSMELFKKIRPRDINLEVAISDKKEVLTYYIFDEPALNSFSKEIAEERSKTTNYKIISRVNIKTKTLAEILDEHLPQGQKIDFLSIDVEGLDFQVLRSNNWQKYRPEVVLVEALELSGMSVDMIVKSDLCKFVKDKGYSMFAKLFYTIFFKREDSV